MCSILPKSASSITFGLLICLAALLQQSGKGVQAQDIAGVSKYHLLGKGRRASPPNLRFLSV